MQFLCDSERSIASVHCYNQREENIACVVIEYQTAEL